MDHLHLSVQDFRVGLLKGLFSFIPSASFNEKTVDMNTIFWSSIWINLRLIKNLEVHIDLINGNDVLSSVVLL